MENELVWDIAQRFLMLVIQLFIPLLLAWLGVKIRRLIEEKRKESWFQALEDIVAQAVSAAEQLGLTDQLSEFAETKLDYAIQYIEQQLALRGIPIDIDPFIDAIRGMIEAEVQRQFPKYEIEVSGELIE